MQRARSAFAVLAGALLAAGVTQVAAGTDAHAAARTVSGPCVRPGQATYPVDYYWKNPVGWRLDKAPSGRG
ncbi:hypothetical protein [Actinoallomurus iriomotensis]|uniref:Uncharacterized protein n=1 Tax=Actinoallomurus iriomotensis TaxID=478107 RepID=A0A9W6VYZ7_9ACTN|nr:hypothetical protein [Actinoallomurus iriomotensis]GLY84202.1 hypothetical protein Airi02_021310 [Actinoallomurus iriomotensis]